MMWRQIFLIIVSTIMDEISCLFLYDNACAMFELHTVFRIQLTGFFSVHIIFTVDQELI